MAAPQYSELPKANGKIAPAIWDEANEQWIVLRGNPDGSMNVSGNISVDNLPDVQNVLDETTSQKVESLRQLVEQQGQQTKNVADSAALTELQAMKADIAETKQTQSEILEKLNGTLDTNTTVTGSNVEKITVETIIGAQTVDAGAYTDIDFGITNESGLYILVASDVQPWKFNGNVPWYDNTDWSRTDMFYPDTNHVEKTTTDTHPEVVFYMGVGESTNSTTFNAPSTLKEAKEQAIPPLPNFRAKYTNRSDVTATLGITVIRIWRD